MKILRSNEADWENDILYGDEDDYLDDGARDIGDGDDKRTDYMRKRIVPKHILLSQTICARNLNKNY